MSEPPKRFDRLYLRFDAYYCCLACYPVLQQQSNHQHDEYPNSNKWGGLSTNQCSKSPHTHNHNNNSFDDLKHPLATQEYLPTYLLIYVIYSQQSQSLYRIKQPAICSQLVLFFSYINLILSSNKIDIKEIMVQNEMEEKMIYLGYV